MINLLLERFITDPDYHSECDIPWFSQEMYQEPSEPPVETGAQKLVLAPSNLKSQSTKENLTSAPLHPLLQHLEEDHFQLDMSYPTPGIKGGFLEGYTAYLQSPVHETLRVVLIIVPEYRLKKGYQGDSAFSVASIDKNDYDKIWHACSNAIQKDKDQKGCKPGQI